MPIRKPNRYRVCVKSYVVVQARNAKEAPAKAELAVRQAIEASYRDDEGGRWGEPWERFGFQATGKPERIEQEPIE